MRALAILAMAAVLPAAAGIRYSIQVPSEAALGDPVTAVLRAEATGSGGETPGFDDPRLVVELRGDGEPVKAVLNHKTIVAGQQTVRIQNKIAPVRLAAGEKRERRLRLLELFPEQVLKVGAYGISFAIEGVGAAPVARVRVTARRESVEKLCLLLGEGKPSTRRRAGALLRRLTGQAIGDDEAPWRKWWEQTGRTLAWNGGVVYRTVPLPEEWKRRILEGQLADGFDARPGTRYAGSADVTAALLRLLRESGPRPELLRVMAAMPDKAMAAPLRAYENDAAARALLEIVEPVEL